MVINRKEIPEKEESSRGNLPYPVTPPADKTEFEDIGREFESPDHNRQSQHLSPNPATQSQLSIASVSDISEDWVDGDPRAHDDPTVSAVTLLSTSTVKPPEIPVSLKVGGKGLTPKSSNESNCSTRKASPKPTEDLPSSLRVQAPSSEHQTNPFRAAASQENHTLPSGNDLQDNTSVWAEVPAESKRPVTPIVTGPSALGVSERGHDSHDEDNMRPEPLKISSPKSPKSQITTDPTSSANPVVNQYLEEIETSPWAGTGAPADVDPSAKSDPYRNLEVLGQQTSRMSLNEEEAPKYSVPTGEANSPFASAYSHPAIPGMATESSVNTQPGPSYTSQPQNINTDLNRADSLSRQYQPEVLATQNLPLQHHDTLESSSPEVVPPSTETPQPTRPSTISLPANVEEQRNETYQIKLIRWLDSNSSGEIRTTPIMIQNKNGPCPLLALVNALTLSTLPQLNTPLVETLRVRENVTLGLLLDAVFDELMSGRRGNTAQELPDVAELYAFLVNLHSGLNVNPRFVPQMGTLIEGIDVQNTSQDLRKPGGFEHTHEMKLYATFSIPLIHGWLPSKAHPAFAALQRSAATYDDAQNLLFREEELEDKLQNSGLGLEEQQLLEDIATIKYFLSSSATQLTGYGLDALADNLVLGSISILFRNDHFSTLYRHPSTGQLLTLVTDAGYAGHEEVVWESLVDVSGEGAEFFSGDFRPVGHQGTQAPSQSGGTWNTVPPRNQNRTSNPSNPQLPHRPSQSISSTRPQEEDEYNLPSPRNTVQEDEDLALALQLQEEEEQIQRQAAEARRNNEERASQAYLAGQQQTIQQGHNRRSSGQPTTPNSGRRARNHQHTPSSTSNNNSSLPNLPRRPGQPGNSNDPEAGVDAPPPTYEQASKARPYQPPANQPAYQNSNVPPQGAFGNQGVHGRRTSQQAPPAGPGGAQAAKKDKDCIVM